MVNGLVSHTPVPVRCMTTRGASVFLLARYAPRSTLFKSRRSPWYNSSLAVSRGGFGSITSGCSGFFSGAGTIGAGWTESGAGPDDLLPRSSVLTNTIPSPTPEPAIANIHPDDPLLVFGGCCGVGFANGADSAISVSM